jgi:multiple sugar transport system substrate-binding protein
MSGFGADRSCHDPRRWLIVNAVGRGVSRRQALRAGLALGLAVPLSGSLVGGCTGFNTSGSEAGALTFLSTQFNPIEEAERFRRILRQATSRPVNYVTASDPSQFQSTIRAQVGSGQVRVSLLGGLHGELAPLANGLLEDLSALMAELSDRHYSADFRELAKAGTDRTWYIPWAQATYLVAVHKPALAYLPRGADPNKLTYQQFLDWAVAARQVTGQPQFGLPAGNRGLLYRFLQGYLYPSFTGGQVTSFRGAPAVDMWRFLKNLWANCTPASANFAAMQEPLLAGQVQVAWDHVARLVQAPAPHPAEWLMVPAPAGPKGRGYMPVLTGLAIPKGAPDVEGAKAVIRALCTSQTQNELLRQNSFFPTVAGPLPTDLPPAIRLEADAVSAQQHAPDALIALPPVGLGKQDGEMSKVFRDAFTSIVLQGADIRATLDQQARVMQSLLDSVAAPCWAPDPSQPGQTCRVA